jgi:nucleoside-diphosphate-sugar epimerase
VRIPYHVFYLACWLWEKYTEWSRNQLPPVFNRRMCSVYYGGNSYSNEKLKLLLGWKPTVPMDEALKRYFAYVRGLRRE